MHIDAHQVTAPVSVPITSSYQMKTGDDINIKNEISEAIKGTFVVVLLGYSGKGYAHPDRLRDTILELLHTIMTNRQLEEKEVSLIAGATTAGIGLAYDAVQANFKQMKTIGIVSAQAQKDPGSLSPFCRKRIFIHPPENNKDSWETNDEEGISWAIRAAAMEGILGSIVIKLGGGEIAEKEFGQAGQLGIETEEHEFEPRPAGNNGQ